MLETLLIFDLIIRGIFKGLIWGLIIWLLVKFFIAFKKTIKTFAAENTESILKAQQQLKERIENLKNIDFNSMVNTSASSTALVETKKILMAYTRCLCRGDISKKTRKDAFKAKANLKKHLTQKDKSDLNKWICTELLKEAEVELVMIKKQLQNK